MMTYKLRLLKSGHGDLQLAEWTDEDVNSIEEARQIFAREAIGRMAFRRDAQGKTALVTEFCEDSEMLLIPPIAGG